MARYINISAITLLLAAAIVVAQTPATSPATQPVGVPKVAGKAMRVTVVSVSGQAEKMLAGSGGKWTSLAAGQKLDELTIIRTGLRSEVVLKFADRGQTVVLAATKVGIAEFSKQGNLVKMHLGLKYGRLKVAVDSTRGPNEAKVSTPVATLSVRGTTGVIGFGGNRLVLRGQSGTWGMASGVRSRNVVAGESTDGNLIQPIMMAKIDRDAVTIPIGTTPAEFRELVTNPRPLAVTDTGDALPPSLPGRTSGDNGTPGHIILGM